MNTDKQQVPEVPEWTTQAICEALPSLRTGLSEDTAEVFRIAAIIARHAPQPDILNAIHRAAKGTVFEGSVCVEERNEFAANLARELGQAAPSAEVQRLREALGFYAGKPRQDRNGYAFDKEPTGIRGDVARAALSAPSPEKPAQGPSDGEMLDWLEKERPWLHNMSGKDDGPYAIAPGGKNTVYGKTFRQAIAAAMSRQTEEGR